MISLVVDELRFNEAKFRGNFIAIAVGGSLVVVFDNRILSEPWSSRYEESIDCSS